MVSLEKYIPVEAYRTSERENIMTVEPGKSCTMLSRTCFWQLDNIARVPCIFQVTFHNIYTAVFTLSDIVGNIVRILPSTTDEAWAWSTNLLNEGNMAGLLIVLKNQFILYASTENEGWEVSQLTYLETSQPGFHQKVVSYFAVFPTKNGILCGIGVVPKFVLVGNLLFSLPKCQ